MKANRLVVAGIALSVLMSGASLAWQAKKTTGYYDQYYKPLQVSPWQEIDLRMIYAELNMLRYFVPMKNGMSAPQWSRVSEDHNVVICKVYVRSDLLPKDFEARKAEMMNVATEAFVSVCFHYPPASKLEYPGWENIYVVFYDMGKFSEAVKNKSAAEIKKFADDPGIVAEVINGRLTMR